MSIHVVTSLRQVPEALHKRIKKDVMAARKHGLRVNVELLFTKDKMGFDVVELFGDVVSTMTEEQYSQFWRDGGRIQYIKADEFELEVW